MARLTSEKEYENAINTIKKLEAQEEKIKARKAALQKTADNAKFRITKKIVTAFSEMYKKLYNKELQSVEDLNIIKKEHEIATQYLQSSEKEEQNNIQKTVFYD